MENLKLEKCQFCWKYWKGTVKEFVNEIRSQSTEDVCDRDLRKYSWSLPAVVMVIQDFKQGQLSHGELFMVMSVKVQKRVQLLTQDNKIVTLPFSTNLKFYEFQKERKSESKSHSLRSLISKKLAVDSKGLLLRLDEESVKGIDDSNRFLSGLLTFMESYEENFLICIPISDKSEQGLHKWDCVTIPAYYPIKLAIANAFIDLNGSDRLEDLYQMFIANYGNKISACSSTLQELTISSLPEELYEEIETDCEHNVPSLNSNCLGASLKFKTNQIPVTSQKIQKIDSGFTYLSPLTNTSQNLSSDGFQTYFRLKNKCNKKKAIPRTPKIRDQFFFNDGFSSIPKNMFETKQKEEYKKDLKNIDKHFEAKLPLTSTKSMIDLSILSRYEDYRTKTKHSNSQKTENINMCATSKADEVKLNKKNSRGSALSQLFNILKRHSKNDNRKNKSLICTENSDKQLLFNYQHLPNKFSERSDISCDDNTNNDYDNIGSPLINKTIFNFENESITSSKRPLSKSMDVLNENIATLESAQEIESGTLCNYLCYSNSNLSKRQITNFKASPDSFKDKENSCITNYCEQIENGDNSSEVVLSQKNNHVDDSRKTESSDSNNYIDMVTTYITSNNESSKTFRKWTTLQEVPNNVSDLMVNEVCICLDLLNLSKYVKRFHSEQIDGGLLCSLTQEILQNDLKMSQFEALKLMKFVKEGWRPR